VRPHADRISNELRDYRADFLRCDDEYKCSECHNTNAVLTSAQALQFQLICHSCGYQEPQLSLNEMRELL